jgi:D-proline reductase (dithiol) PrdB
VGLIARQAEAAGISTLCMTSALDITQSVQPPRAAFLDYPLGHTTGKPHAPALQRDILMKALEGFKTLTVPGTVLRLPFQWSETDEWKETAQRGPDDRLPRYDTPQYQNEADQRRAETSGDQERGESRDTTEAHLSPRGN